MLDGLSEGIVAVDNEGRVTHTNPALERLFTRQKPMLHLPDPRMKIIPDKTIWEDFDGVIRTGESMTRTFQAREMTLRLTITPTVDEIGAIAGAVGLHLGHHPAGAAGAHPARIRLQRLPRAAHAADGGSRAGGAAEGRHGHVRGRPHALLRHHPAGGHAPVPAHQRPAGAFAPAERHASPSKRRGWRWTIWSTTCATATPISP